MRSPMRWQNSAAASLNFSEFPGIPSLKANQKE